jgi:hypothetical protein
MCPEKKFAVIVLCNRTGASLPRVAQKASELVLGIVSPKREPRGKPTETTSADLERYAGTYSNGKTTIRLFMRNGKLMAPAGGQLEKVGENRFLRTGGIVGPDTEMVFVSGEDGKVEYLCRGGRALRRIATR